MLRTALAIFGGLLFIPGTIGIILIGVDIYDVIFGSGNSAGEFISSLKMWLLTSCYFVAVVCFSHVSETDNKKWAMFYGALFPVALTASYFIFIYLIEMLFDPRGNEAVFMAILPAIALGIILAFVINKPLVKNES